LALLKATGAVVASLILIIYVYGHVEQRRLVAESAVDCKYAESPRFDEPSLRVPGVAKLDFTGHETFSETRPTIEGLLGRAKFNSPGKKA